MIVTDISLRNWRNHESLSVTPSPKVNLIIGSNGSGKTNLAEAIYYLSLGRTWRGLGGSELIRDGEQEAIVKASVKEGDIVRRLEFDVYSKRRAIYLNEKPIKRLSDLSKASNVIAFSPQNTSIFSGPPANRRDFLDLAIAKEDPTHINNLNAFLKILQERNAVLKNEIRDDTYLEVLTERLIELQRPIVEKRSNYIRRLAPVIGEIASKIFSDKRVVGVEYAPFVPLEGDYEAEARRIYNDSLPADIARGTTSKGIHKEDYTVTLDGKDVGAYGSQGENRILSLAMHLAPFFLVEDENKKPIVVLDDVYSELDEAHAANLSKLLWEMGQVFVTTTNKNIENASVIEVSKKLP